MDTLKELWLGTWDYRSYKLWWSILSQVSGKGSRKWSRMDLWIYRVYGQSMAKRRGPSTSFCRICDKTDTTSWRWWHNASCWSSRFILLRKGI